MAPLPPSNTPRIFVVYTSMGKEHTCEVRLNVAFNASSWAALAQDVATINSLRMRISDTSIRAEYSPANSGIRFPLAHTAVPGTIADDQFWGQDPESTQLTICGKGSVTGRRWRYTLFSPVRTGSWPGTNRYNPGASPVIDTWQQNVKNLVNGGGSTGIVLTTIGLDKPIVYDYVNISQNAYWQREQR